MDFTGYKNEIIENNGNSLIIIGELQNELIFILKERGQIVVKTRKMSSPKFQEIIYYNNFSEALDENEILGFRIKHCLRSNIPIELISLE
jgi:hypothetical protein